MKKIYCNFYGLCQTDRQEKQVWAKYPKSEQEIAYDQFVSKVNSANAEYDELMEKAKDQVLKDLVAKYGIVEDMCKNKRSDYHPFETWGSQVKLDSEKALSKRREIAKQKIEDIIVTLELGGTKADLEKMLSEI